MPVRYGSIPQEHEQVRRSGGLFDLCHMGRLELRGPGAAAWANRLISNDYDAMAPGDARYTLILQEGGTILDDAIVYKVPEENPDEHVFLVVNASNRQAVKRWFDTHRDGCRAALVDRTRELGMISIQGQVSASLLAKIVQARGPGWADMKYYSITPGSFRERPLHVARTGYTGEDGFEIYLEADATPALWSALLECGGEALGPIGLGARDTLRLEAAMPLYGQEIDNTTHPYEAGLGFAVKLDKAGGFVGRDALATLRARAREEGGLARRLTGFRVGGRRVARQGMKILSNDAVVGEITSGAPSPTLGHPIALGYLASEAAGRPDLVVDIRGHHEQLAVQATPFFSRLRKPSGPHPP